MSAGPCFWVISSFLGIAELRELLYLCSRFIEKEDERKHNCNVFGYVEPKCHVAGECGCNHGCDAAANEEREKVSLTMKYQSSMESKTEHDFKKNKKEDMIHSRDENDTSSSLKSNITFTKA